MKPNWIIHRTKNIVALAAMLLFSACGNGLPSESHIQSLFQKLPKVKGLTTNHELKRKSTVQSSNLETVRYAHYYQGVEVLGSEVRYHKTSSENESATESIKDVDVMITPTITEDSARAKCSDSEAESLSLKILPGKTSRLVYIVQCKTGDEIWMDAHDGSVLAQVSESQEVNGVYSAAGTGMVVSYHDDGCEIGPINEAKSKFYKKESCAKKSLTYCQLFNTNMMPVGFNPIKCSPSKTNDESAKRADLHSRRFFEYLKSVHQRNGYDNLGTPIVSIVHAGIKHTNASWYKKGKYIVYGDGDGTEFRDFTLAADIAGHEMTHALIQHTAKLASFGESGALNEAIADFFGSLVEGQNNWNIGEELYVDQSNAKAIRDLKDPSRLQMPKHSKDASTFTGTCDGNNDYCGVHLNATIPGHALYLIHERIGRSASEKLLYEALTHFFNETTDFKEAAKGILSACALTLSDSQCELVKSAFQDTGL